MYEVASRYKAKTEEARQTNHPIKYFVQEMNRYARALNLENTNYANPHGLSHANNKSTAYDIGRLAAIAMQDSLIREIVQKQSYTCEGRDIFENEKQFQWSNTNKLLSKGFNGLKTGVTPAAGPCLSASFEKGNLHLIVVVLQCKTMDNRWIEVPKLTLWAINRLNKLSEFFMSDEGKKMIAQQEESKKKAAS